jgi:uncharacterized protein involved in response to NO
MLSAADRCRPAAMLPAAHRPSLPPTADGRRRSPQPIADVDRRDPDRPPRPTAAAGPDAQTATAASAVESDRHILRAPEVQADRSLAAHRSALGLGSCMIENGSSARAHLPIHGAPVERAARGWPLAAKGFRPFFLLAGLFATLAIPGWLLVLDGRLEVGGYLDPMSWHAHEMVFGFATAVIAGFLLTAVASWTQRETVVGAPLLALAALWSAGRLAIGGPQVAAPWLTAVVDLAFLPALGLAIARPLIATRNARNYGMLAVLAALFAANLVVHLDVLGVLPGYRRRGGLLGIDVIVVVILVISGRTFPMFTRNATGVAAIGGSPRLDRLAIAGMVGLVALDAVVPEHAITAAWAAVVGVLAAARSWRWGARHALGTPLLWILHAGYLWIPVGLGLRAVAAFTGAVSPQIATHALTVGAIGSLTLGMMARVGLGHTGRVLATTRPVAIAFGLVLLAAAARVVAPVVVMDRYRAMVFVAGALWTAAFAVFVATYAAILASPRVDGRPG